MALIFFFFPFFLLCGMEYLPVLFGHLFWSKPTASEHSTLSLPHSPSPPLTPSLTSASPAMLHTHSAGQGPPKQGGFQAWRISELLSWWCCMWLITCIWVPLPWCWVEFVLPFPPLRRFQGSNSAMFSKHLDSQSSLAARPPHLWGTFPEHCLASLSTQTLSVRHMACELADAPHRG